MKFFALSWMALFITASAVAQDTIANPGFENWTDHGGNYEAPDDWTTLNPLTYLVGVQTATKTTTPTEVHSGSFAVKLTTKSLAGNPRPGLVTTGTVNVNAGTIDGGIPIHSRPLAMNGWFQYAPAGTDAASFQIYLYKWNSTSGTHDEIGMGTLSVDSAVSTWTHFSVPVTYTTSDIPDTVKIVIYSSDLSPQINSALLLDDLSYDYTTGISNEEKSSLNIFPNPASEKIVFENSTNISSAEVYSLQGRMLAYFSLTQGLNELNVSSLKPGIYLFSAKQRNGAVSQRTFTIQR